MEEDDKPCQAVLVENGRIQKTGSLDKVKEASRNAEMIDLKGNTLMPAFIDGHSHFSSTMQLSITADLSECKDLEDIVRVLEEFKKRRNPAKEDIILGTGYDQNFLSEKKHPTKEYLNRVSEEIPIYVSHVSGHMGCANDAALHLLGISEDTPEPEGGRIGRMPGSREPDGYLEEAAVIKHVGKLTDRIKMDSRQAAKEAEELYFSYGITTVQEGAASEQTFSMLKELAEAGELKIDIVAYPLITEGAEEIFKRNPEYAKQYRRHLKLGGYKLILDGSPQGRSAWMTEPYENSGGYCGYPAYEDKEVEDFMQRTVEQGRQILVHCNGDAASEQFIRAYQQALKKSSNPKKTQLRPVMIHCQTVRDDQLDKMKELSMIPSIFTGHIYYWGDIHLQNFGYERGSRISPCQSAFLRNLKVNFHQDTPVTKPDMLHSIWCAANRITRSGKQIGSGQCCSVSDGLKAATINPAYAYFEEKEKGSIKEGKIADLVILSENPLTADKKHVKDILVLETIKEGETVYRLL